MSARPVLWLTLGLGGLGLVALLASDAEAAVPALVPPLDAHRRVTSPFGRRVDPVTRQEHVHTGIDVAAPRGTPVRTPEGGVVERIDVDGVGRGSVNGNAVLVRSGRRLWAMIHLDSVGVRAGQRLAAGDVVGRAGSTGRSTGPHLHLQLAIDGKAVDPVPYFAPGTWA